MRVSLYAPWPCHGYSAPNRSLRHVSGRTSKLANGELMRDQIGGESSRLNVHVVNVVSAQPKNDERAKCITAGSRDGHGHILGARFLLRADVGELDRSLGSLAHRFEHLRPCSHLHLERTMRRRTFSRVGLLAPNGQPTARGGRKVTCMFRRSTFTRRPLHPLNTTPPTALHRHSIQAARPHSERQWMVAPERHQL